LGQRRSPSCKKFVKPPRPVARGRTGAETGAVRTPGRARWFPAVRLAVIAVGLPGLVMLLAAMPFRVSAAAAALGFVLAVTGAALIGGSAAGLVASVVSFLALNLLFTEPRGTFSVRKTEDLVALVVFLLVAAVVGTLVSRANALRHRAERREREARLLQHLGTRLLSGTPLESVFESFGRALVDLTGLAGYEVIQQGRPPVVVGTIEGQGLLREDFPVLVGDDRVAEIRTYARQAESGLRVEERHLIGTFAGQMALAMESSRLASEARGARIDAERSSLQAALFSSVTHDLRTPLASILASVTGLQDTDAKLTTRGRSELQDTIYQEAHRLNRLVGNLMDLSRLRAGALVPSKRPTAIEEVVEGVLARMEPALRGHRLNVLLREDLPMVPADVVQIDQALTNILENAAKFSPPGSEITVHAARWENTVQVRIADRGPPIPADLRERVFEPFVRGDDGAAGTGLGLAIARAVVVAHGGRIWIEDAPGGGTSVVLRLPVDP
jgi:two-component system, OmpR family, sensor histidine kinase KdpD